MPRSDEATVGWEGMSYMPDGMPAKDPRTNSRMLAYFHFFDFLGLRPKAQIEENLSAGRADSCVRSFDALHVQSTDKS